MKSAFSCAVAILAISVASAQTPDLDVQQIRPDFYVISGAGGNIGVQIGSDGTLVVDAGTEDRADAVVDAIRKIAKTPVRYVIDTGPDADHVGGNAAVAKAGQTLFNISNSPLAGLTNGGAAAILSAEGVLHHMSAPAGGKPPFPSDAWPTETFDGRRSYMYLNGQGIETLHQPAAHSDGDSIVFFRRSDVVMAGDVIDTRRFPVIDIAHGGSIQGELDALNKLVELAIPSFPLVWQQAGTYVVPGHGRIYTQYDVVEYRDMVTIVRDRVRALIADGRTLEQVQTARPTRGYPQFGAASGPWTTAMFVEAIYQSLVQQHEAEKAR